MGNQPTIEETQKTSIEGEKNQNIIQSPKIDIAKDDWIQLAHQKLKELPIPEEPNKEAEILLADFNELERLPETLGAGYPSLVELSLSGNMISTFSRHSFAHTLQILNLGCNRISLNPSSLECFSSPDHFPHLRELILSGNDLTCPVFPDLSALSTLRTLNVCENSLFSSMGAEALAAKLPASLTSLSIASNAMPAGLSSSLAAFSARLTALTLLNLSECAVEDAALPHLLQMTSLTSLSMNTNYLTSLGIGEDDAPSAWPKMRKLSVNFNQIRSLPSFLKSFTLRLVEFGIDGNPCILAAPLPSIDYPQPEDRQLYYPPESADAINAQLQESSQKIDPATVGLLPPTIKSYLLPAFPLPDLILAEGLYLGDWYCAQNLSALQALGIKKVLCVAQFPLPYQSSLAYHRIFIRDADSENLLEFFEEACQFIDSALNNSEKILVHCRAGASRSATVVIAYLIQKFRIPPKEAYDYVKKNRSCISPNNGFVSQLDQWAEQLSISHSS